MCRISSSEGVLPRAGCGLEGIAFSDLTKADSWLTRGG